MSSSIHGQTSRRDWLRMSLGSALGVSASGWFPTFARAAGQKPNVKSCILLWMSGGPSQTDTFDLKPGHKNGGPFKQIETSVPGIRVSEHLPGVARQMKDLALIRGMSTSAGDHQRGTQLMLSGYRPGQAALKYPTLGALVAKELGRPNSDLPSFVSISPLGFAVRAGGAGFLGPQFAPLVVSGESNDPQARANLSIENLAPPRGVSTELIQDRLKILRFLQDEFRARSTSRSVASHRANYDRAARMVESQARHAFRLSEETNALRDKYGRTQFGQGCLLARRLVERGVTFVEVALSRAADNAVAWDTHQNNFARVRMLSEILDPAWSTLMEDLRERGLLDSTLIVWMGEFGRTPTINPNGGRDHYPAAWTSVLGGGAVKGGQVIGNTGADGVKVVDRPVNTKDFCATMFSALGVDPAKRNFSDEGRPVTIVDENGKPIPELVG
ncbi:MAG: hypothetical protein CMJ48_01220 [Planctomycetaceae bacterium]|nr:hypothetical protein [Planctomycetaceae bacterium]